MTAFGLVLAGGGTRGAYQLGVWQALKEAKIRIDAIAGVSIGAINGALFCQDDWELTWQAWHEIGLDDIINLPGELPVPANLFDRRNWPALTKAVLSQKGLDTTPLRRLMDRFLDEEIMRSSGLAYGVMAFSLSEFQPVSVFMDELAEGKMFDYILASASLPLFRTVKLDGQRLVDGGVYNNLPTEMLLSRGYKDIIEVEVGGLGRVRPHEQDGLNIISIKPKRSLGGIFDLNHDLIDANIELGLKDGRKVLKAHGLA